MNQAVMIGIVAFAAWISVTLAKRPVAWEPSKGWKKTRKKARKTALERRARYRLERVERFGQYAERWPGDPRGLTERVNPSPSVVSFLRRTGTSYWKERS